MKKKIDKKKIYMILGIILLIITLIGSVYAYFSAIAVDENTVKGSVAGGTNLELEVERISKGANDALIPLDNSADMLTTAAIGYNNTSKDNNKRCLDKNGYTVCQVYRITITNDSSIPVALDGGVSLQGENTPYVECAIMDDNNTITNNASCKGTKSLADNMTLDNGESKDYYIIVYINNINDMQTDSGDFNGTVTFSVSGDKIETNFDDETVETITTRGNG